MVNEGRLAPVVDVVQALRDEAAGAGSNSKGGGGSGGGGRGEDAAKGGGKRKAARKDVRSHANVGAGGDLFGLNAFQIDGTTWLHHGGEGGGWRTNLLHALVV